VAWITKAESKAYSANTPEITGAADAYLDALILRAEAIIKDKTEQDFVKASAIVKLENGNGAAQFWLNTRLYALTALVVDTSVLTSYVFLEYGDNYTVLKFDPDPAFAYRSYRHFQSNYAYLFSYGVRNISITGDWGWAAVPEEIKTLDKMIVERLGIMDANNRITASPFLSEKIGDYSYNKAYDLRLGDMMSSEMKSLINKYKWQNAEDFLLYKRCKYGKFTV